MDIYKYINSTDVRKHLEEINYQFNTLEAAYLIYFCRSLTLEERHQAWQELIDTMPDMSPKDHFDHCRWVSFEDSILSCLKQHIRNEKKILEEFSQITKGAFCIRLVDKNGKEFDSYYYSYWPMFKIDEVYDFIHTYIEDDEGELCKYKIYCKVDGSKKRLCITMSRNDEVLEVEIDDEHYPRPRLDIQLESMWFAFPTPFKKGDILIDPERPEPSGLWSGPFVFQRTAAEYLTSKGKQGHDCTDMTANGWFQDEDGIIYSECMHDYMSLEYYPIEKLQGVQKTLIALSNQIKGKIDYELFLNAYHSILMEEYAKKIRPRYFSEEGLALAGLK